VTLGGDGTILYACKFFHGENVPPIISFSMGSLSYLCYFEFEDYKSIMERLFFKKFSGDDHLDPVLDIRMRLKIKSSH